MRPLSCFSLPIRVDHSRDTKLIFFVAPAEGHLHVRPIRTLNRRLVEIERPFHRLFRKNHSGKIGSLQEFNKTTDERLAVSDDIEKNAAAVAGEHDVPRLWFILKFGLRGETGVSQNSSQVNRSRDRGETMIGNDKHVCCSARI